MVWICVTVVVVLVLVAEIAIQWTPIRIVRSMIENTPPFNATKRQPNPLAERVEFPTSDGLTLRGAIYKQPASQSKGLIVFCHEYGGDHWSVMDYCEGLWEEGFDLFAFDFRNHGESDSVEGYDPLHWLDLCEVDDMRAALDFVESRADLATQPTGLFGISRGGTAALIGAAERRNIVAVATEGAFSMKSMLMMHARKWISLVVASWLVKLIPRWHVLLTLKIVCKMSERKRNCRYAQLENWLGKLKSKPVLMISGQRDKYVHTDVTRELCQRMSKSDDSIWVVKKARHNEGRIINQEAYDKRVCDFFSQLRPAQETHSPMRESEASVAS